MKPAHYSLIRFIPDPARSEALNIGIIAWDENDYRLKIEQAALERVVRENPFLAKDALAEVDSVVRRFLVPTGHFSEEKFLYNKNHLKFPIIVGEPLYTTIEETEPNPLDQTIDRLIVRIVKPRRPVRSNPRDPVKMLEKQVISLIRNGLIYKDHPFTNSRSGVSRRVDFYANSKANTAVDVLKVNLVKGDQIRERADAEAFKVEDIKNKNDVKFIVCCDFSDDPRLGRANEEVTKIIRSAGAIVSSDLEQVGMELASLNTG